MRENDFSNVVEDEEFWSVTADEDAVKIAELERQLYIDPVLGCNNRAKFEADAANLGSDYTIFSVDANNLKYVNDNFGHEQGDVLLAAVVSAGKLVWGDNFYRQGGDEFTAIVRGTAQTIEQSNNQVALFKSYIDNEAAKHPEFPVSASIGYANSIDGKEVSDIVSYADEMMYSDKAAYKAANPQYDMRRARLDKDSLKVAIHEGLISDVVEKYREEKGIKRRDTKTDSESSSLKEVGEEFSDGFVGEFKEEEPKKEVTALSTTQDEDFAGFDISSDEQSYKEEELQTKIQPVIKEVVETQSDKLKQEVNDALQDEVGKRLNRYDKRRRRRDLKDFMGLIIRGVVVVLIIVFLMSNNTIRTRFAICFRDLGNIVQGVINGEEVSSNQLVEDLFGDLGDDLNRVNTVYVDEDGNLISGSENNDKEVNK